MPVEFVVTADSRIEVEVRGVGEAVVLLPSLGRGFTDFAHLAGSLCEAGYRCLAVNPRQIGNSLGPLSEISLHDLAADVAAVVVSLDARPAHVVGHAFGNRVARCLATDRPDLVRRIILLGAGGRFPPEAAARDAMIKLFTKTHTVREMVPLMRTALFARGSDARAWCDGWWPQTALAQISVARSTATESWWSGGSAPMLVIQGLSDRLAPPANGRALNQEFPRRTRLIELERAGHAMLSERPDAVAESTIAFLGDPSVNED